MSLDIWPEADVGGPEPLEGPNLNITHNLRKMSRAAGADPWEWGGRTLESTLEETRTAIKALEDDPQRFESMNPPNGWGNRRGLLEWLWEVADVTTRYPKASWGVSR